MEKLDKYRYKLIHVQGGGKAVVAQHTNPHLTLLQQTRAYKQAYLLKKGGGAEDEGKKENKQTGLQADPLVDPETLCCVVCCPCYCFLKIGECCLQNL